MHKDRKICSDTITYVMIVKPRMIAVNVAFEVVTIITVTMHRLLVRNWFIRGHHGLLLSLVLISAQNVFSFPYNLVR